MNKAILLSLFLFLSLISNAQNKMELDSLEDGFTPYELLSSYYDESFKPFKKGKIYLGFAFSLENKKLENTNYLVQQVIDGDRSEFDLSLKGGYYTGDYGMVGLNVSYHHMQFEGTIFRSPDTLQSQSISRGFEITPNFRSSVPLTPNERLSFYTLIGVTFGMDNTLSEDLKNVDEISRVYETDYNLRLGISPGITFFAMENFAFEVQLNLLGYELQVHQTRVDKMDESKEIRQNVDFNINILSLQLGLAYYFGKGTKK
ncbi:hypothetical protein [Reichenbachiella ulvae]|uniref:Outer membrane protein beta-barrel domain-containing protein n=1 Tax=Reichenbachiella ulvae TaxID=2980104 RepID=A0ABT3CSP9_9BACT|nr:hypothetical protein [Reichenbachiella ulvae]MCV9386278.1 hypothetical protein [Reichenbachiella ulvae]